MGMFDGLFGGGGGAGTADISSPVTQDQINTAYGNTQTGLQQNQQLAQALQAQNGVANQGSVFGQQQDLSNALAQQAQGQGPNPAQAQLNQNTGNNIASQAALMAGQRGAGANAGLLARQAGQQGAGIQQQAVGQAATLQAQQQIAAEQALQQQQQNMAGVAQNQVANQQAAQTAYGTEANQQQANLLGAQGQYNTAAVTNQANANKTQAGLLGGIGSAIGPIGDALGDVWDNVSDLVGGFGSAAGGVASDLGGAASSLGADAVGGGSGASLGELGEGAAMVAYTGGKIPHIDQMAAIYHPKKLAQGGKVPVMLSPGEKKLSPNDAKKVAQGKKSALDGKTVPGQATVQGNSIKNDTVAAKESPGTIIIPREVLASPNREQAAHDFVANELRKKKPDIGTEHEDFHAALSKAISSRGKK